jgi:hypothetical protein
MWERREMHTEFYLEILKGRDSFEDGGTYNLEDNINVEIKNMVGKLKLILFGSD